MLLYIDIWHIHIYIYIYIYHMSNNNHYHMHYCISYIFVWFVASCCRRRCCCCCVVCVCVCVLFGVYLSNTASFGLCAFCRVKDHRKLLHDSPLLRKSCVRQVVSDKRYSLGSSRDRIVATKLTCVYIYIYMYTCIYIYIYIAIDRYIRATSRL